MVRAVGIQQEKLFKSGKSTAVVADCVREELNCSQREPTGLKRGEKQDANVWSAGGIGKSI